MTITEKVADTLDNRADDRWDTPLLVDLIINSFLEAVAEEGWRLVRVEPTEAMRYAGMEEAPLNYYKDGPSSRRRISMDTDEVGPVYRAMIAAAPKFNLEE